VLCALSGRYPWQLDRWHWLFAFNSWCLFNIFEFGRKSFLSGEEREHVDSYTKVFGRFGAVMLTFAMAAISFWLLNNYFPAPNVGLQLGPVVLTGIYGFMAVMAALLLGLGIAFAALNRGPWGAAFRGFSSGYIVLTYAGFFVGAFL
jgi:4-hydroxybenzoate polyprenyltransferase